MKRFALLFMLIVLMAGCDGAPDQNIVTQIPPAPTVAPAETGVLDAPPTDSPAESPTAAAVDTALPTVAITPTAEAPTDAPTIAPPPTEEPSPEAATEEPSPEASPEEPSATAQAPTTEPGPESTASLFVPGQQTGTSLPAGGSMAYLVDGRPFQPYILFVEPSNELNVALAAYVGDQTGQTTPEGVTPPAAADNALAGRPEILVLSPESPGLFTLVVRAVAGEGSFNAHLFDLTTPARGVVIQQPDTLDAGVEKMYPVTSNGPRPVIVVADPSDQSDIALDILGEDGTILTTANYSGAGGVETAYVLPLGATTYTVKVREANGGSASYQIIVIALE